VVCRDTAVTSTQPPLSGGTPAAVEVRARLRRGAVYLAGELGLVASTVGRILHGNQVPALTTVDLITGLPVRRRPSGIRYECRNPVSINTKHHRTGTQVFT
jgi:hypothetical protein